MRSRPFHEAIDLLRKPLDHVNAAVSLVTGIVYPSAGIHRVRMEEARDTIQKVKGMLRA